MRCVRPRRIPLGALSVLLLATACTVRSAAEPGRNVLLVVVDTLGAEHVGFLNPERSTTPHLDRLAAESTVFRRAYSPAPWTEPAVASLFTGVMPHAHGVTMAGRRLLPQELTLAERLAQRGYRTGAVISHVLIDARRGFAQGFGDFDDGPVGDEWTLSAKAVSDRAIAWLDREPQAPFFLFLHYFDPHYAYRHHPAHDRSSGYDGPLRGIHDIWALRKRRAAMTPADVAYLVALYHEEIAHTDEHIGRVLAHLRETGRYDDTIVVVAADHGEEFMRHGWIGHTRTLYDELLHVPLLIRLGGDVPPRVLDAPVSLVDVMPTLLAALAPDAPAEPRWAGESLLPRILGSGEAAPRDILGEVSYRYGAPPDNVKTAFKTSLLAGGWKLIHDLPSDRFELYHHASDPEELRDRSRDAPERLEALRPRLLAWETTRSERAPVPGATIGFEPSDQDLERLRRLGYVE